MCVCQRAWTYNVIVYMLYVNDYAMWLMLYGDVVWSNWEGAYPVARAYDLIGE